MKHVDTKIQSHISNLKCFTFFIDVDVSGSGTIRKFLTLKGPSVKANIIDTKFDIKDICLISSFSIGTKRTNAKIKPNSVVNLHMKKDDKVKIEIEKTKEKSIKLRILISIYFDENSNANSFNELFDLR